MEFRQTESELSGEVEYLAALFAFKDQTLGAEDLQLAIARLVSGESPTIIEAIRSLGVVEPVRLAASIKMAQLYCNVNSNHVSNRRYRNDFNQNGSLPRLQHHALGDEAEDEIEFEDAPEQPAPPVGAGYEWQPTSDWASHIYYVEDTLRGYTGGRLGIVSTFALCICVGVVIWGVIESQVFAPLGDDGRSERGLQNQSIDLADTDPFNTGAGGSAILNNEILGDEMLSERTPKNAVTPFGQASSAGQATSPLRENVAPAESAPPNEAADSTDDWLSIPISSTASNDQYSVDSSPSPLAVEAVSEADLIKEELQVAMTEITTNDLTSARTRLSRIYNNSLDDIDPDVDRRWLQLGIGVMLEQDTPESIETADQWLRFTHADNQPLNHWLFARWLLRTSVAQKGVLVEHFAANPLPEDTLNLWVLAASGDYRKAIPALEAEINAASPNPLNHLFLSIAYWVANRPKDVLQQLEQFDKRAVEWSKLDNQSGDSIPTDAQWIKEASMKALEAAAEKLRDRAASAR